MFKLGSNKSTERELEFVDKYFYFFTEKLKTELRKEFAEKVNK